MLPAGDDVQRRVPGGRVKQAGRGHPLSAGGGSCCRGVPVGLELDRGGAEDPVALALGVLVHRLQPQQRVIGVCAGEDRVGRVALALAHPPVYVQDRVLARERGGVQQRRGQLLGLLVEVLLV